jgi:hypothetical protein
VIDLFNRLPEKDQAEFLKQGGAAEFEPMPGRKMKRSLEYASALPAKEKNKKDKKPARKAKRAAK